MSLASAEADPPASDGGSTSAACGQLLLHSNVSSAADAAVASSHSWFPYYWKPTSTFSLAYAEALVLNRITDCQLDASYVMLPCGAEIRTVRAISSSAVDAARSDDDYHSRTPLLLLHGMGAAIGLWCRNIGPLCRQRPVYAIDILGFGRSSRVPFPVSPEACEARFVDSIEQWRLAVGLSSLLLLGHSFGGYLAFCYSVKYPGAVQHLMLADPWGMLEPPPDYRPSALIRHLAAAMEHWSLDPLDLLRAAGPFGPGLVRRLRGDIRRFFADHGNDDDDGQEVAAASGANGASDDILDYIYHCNAQVPSGETGFRRLTRPVAFALRPCLPRIGQLPPELPVSVVFGGRSRLYRLERARGEASIGEKLQSARPAGSCGAGIVREMPMCGHHIYAEDWRAFNRHVLEAFAGY